RNVSTNGQGQFSAAALPIGPYEATISAANYQSARTDGIISQLGGASYNFTLAAATGTDSDIVVTATVQRAIDFSSTATGQVFNVQETAATLPVARNIAAIQLLAPQAIPGDVNFNTANTSGVSLGGSSVAENIYYINGMNVTNFRTFVGGTTVPFEFYDSAVVKTGGYQAEFGRNTGGAVIAVSRSGTNEYRGGFNLYYTPDWARKDAPNTYIANNSLDQRANIEGNIWASGPIIKDHLFFFGFFNPRNLYTQDTSRAETFNSTGTVSNGFSNNTLVKTFQSTPFYGGKIDLNVIDSQRLEFTYFNDSTNVLTKQTVLANNTTASNRSFSGGSNFIGKYTGDFTDWLTVSALYGQSNFNQTTAGSDDNIPYTLDGRSGTLIYV
ncbi:MAG: carboxypeptidase regulatory-like domain-containing protein, partial [Oxalobacteraceae bacterium]